MSVKKECWRNDLFIALCAFISLSCHCDALIHSVLKCLRLSYRLISSLRVLSHSNTWVLSSALHLNSLALFTTKSHPALQQISAREIQLRLTHLCVCAVGTGRRQLTIKKFSHTKVMDSESTLPHCSGLDKRLRFKL